MRYQFEFRPYQRKFIRPLVTSHGTWDIREGIILCLRDETNIGWGEIAPISWFGSETIEQALLFCRQLPTEIIEETIFSIPDELPACQFGFESAIRGTREWGKEELFSLSPCPPVSLSPCPPLSLIPHLQCFITSRRGCFGTMADVMGAGISHV